MDSTDPHADAALGAKALVAAVQNTENEQHDVAQGIHSHGGDHGPENAEHIERAHTPHGKRHAWLEKLIPGVEKLTVKLHVGNYVALRDPTKPPGTTKIFESMPIYARVGMHLLFYGKEQVKLLEGGKVEHVLKEQSVKQGAIYDSPESKHSITSFINTYKIDLNELLEPDPAKYGTFNEFFYRKLNPNARPIQNPDPRAFCCAADCRLTVYQTVPEAQKFWIKGDEFTLQRLLHGASGVPAPSGADTSHQSESFAVPTGDDSSLAIFRLAPADYHRFHAPLSGRVVAGPVDITGTYYTVNPQAVNEVDFDVFTANKRSVLYIRHDVSGEVVAFVAIGALLVGAIGWSKKVGEEVQKGEELGWFAYGGSTVVLVFPKTLIKFDDDLRVNSENVLETLVKVGDSLGVMSQA